jgi:hypothetical protein
MPDFYSFVWNITVDRMNIEIVEFTFAPFLPNKGVLAKVKCWYLWEYNYVK